MRFGRIVLAYFVIGSVMVGGGAIDFQDSGVAKFFVNDVDSGFQPSGEPSGLLGSIGTTIKNLVGSFLGAIQLVYNLIVGLLGYLNWPVVTLLSVNAPPMAVLLVGGSFEVAFYVSVIKLVRASA